MTYVAENLENLEKPQLDLLAKELDVDISDKAFKGLEEWRLVLSLLLEWEKRSESKKRTAQELARILVSIHYRLPTPTENNLFLNLARRLDFTGMIDLYLVYMFVSIQMANYMYIASLVVLIY